MECTNENCELRREIQAIRESTEKFQSSVAGTIESFKKEVAVSIKELDSRQTRSRERDVSELRGEMQRGLMAANAKMDSVAKVTNGYLITISSDLGEIKGALGLKADKDETGQLRTSVMRRIDAAKEEARKEAEREIDALRQQQFKFSHKVLYLIITLLSSGFMLALGNWLANK
jgi:ABC-type phosphate transport system auxiliary subunit